MSALHLQEPLGEALRDVCSFLLGANFWRRRGQSEGVPFWRAVTAWPCIVAPSRRARHWSCHSRRQGPLERNCARN